MAVIPMSFVITENVDYGLDYFFGRGSSFLATSSSSSHVPRVCGEHRRREVEAE